MTDTIGPVIVGMDGLGDESAGVAAALDVAAREAVRRHVDLRLVYGHETVPGWAHAGELLDAITAVVALRYPDLAITTAIYPGSAERALVTASAGASLVVLAADTRLHGDDVIARLLAAPAVVRAPIVVVLATDAPAATVSAPPVTAEVYA